VLLKKGYEMSLWRSQSSRKKTGGRGEYRERFDAIGGQRRKCVGLEPWKG